MATIGRTGGKWVGAEFLSVSMFLLGLSLTILLTIAVSTAIAKGQGERIGPIQCKRCGHIGPAKGQFLPFRGSQLVCGSCGSLDWEKTASTASSAPPPPTPSIAATLRVSGGGTDLGDLPTESVQTMLSTGLLAYEDYYWNAEAQEWHPLREFFNA